MKSGLQHRSVGLVMMTSRYVVIWDRDHAVILPARRRGKHRGPAEAQQELERSPA